MDKTSAPQFLLTRPRDASERFAQSLRARLGEVPVIISPVIEIVYSKPTFELGSETVIFTSVHGVEGISAVKRPEAAKAVCVGERTATAARAAGFTVEHTAPTLAALEPVLAQMKGPLLHARGTYVTAELAARYDKISEINVYDQRSCDLTYEALEALRGEQPVILPLFSPRSARHTAQQIKGSAPLFAAFMSEAVKDAFGDERFHQFRIAQTPDAAAMLDACFALYDAACLLEGDRRGS